MEQLIIIFPYLLGGIGGSVITWLISCWKNRIQKMNCLYLDEDVMSKLPITSENGVIHENIYTKKFHLVNTTNIDQKSFKIIFEFDASAKILKHSIISKGGNNRYKGRLLKDNEYATTIKNFTRKDEVRFLFEIANIKDNVVNVTEDDCIGFKIVLQDKRTKKSPSKLTIVEKDKINSNYS